MSVTLQENEPLMFEEFAVKYGPITIQQPLSRETYIHIAENHPNLAIEREADGTLTIMAALKKGSGRRENRLGFLLNLWNEQLPNKGEVFGPNGTFELPDGSTKMPDVSWISPERLAEMPDDNEEAFITVVPDFVAEIRSKSDSLSRLQNKMSESWIKNGVRLAWLIDPYDEKAYIYKPNEEVVVLESFQDKKLSGDDVLKGFELSLEEMMRRR